MTEAAAGFPLPSSLSVTPGTEAAPAAYLWYMQFEPGDDASFRFYNSMHFLEPMCAFDMVTAEGAYIALGASNTRIHSLPTTKGIDYRILNGRVYIGGVGVTDPAELEERTNEFQQRAFYYYENWECLYDQWKVKMKALIADAQALPTPVLPDYEPLENVHAGKGVASNHTLLTTWHANLEGYFRMWHHHSEFLLLGCGAYMVFFDFCKKAFPEITDQTIARMVAGFEAEIFRPDEEVRRLARREVEQAIVDAMTSWAIGLPPRGTQRWRPLIAERKAALPAWATVEMPPALGQVPDLIDDPAIVMLWGITRESLDRWLDSGEENPNEIKGFAASSGVVEVLEGLAARGIPYLALTNGSAYPARIQAPRLAVLGLPINADNLFTPSSVAAALFAARDHTRVMVLGTAGVRDALEALGAGTCAPGTSDADAVYVAWHPECSMPDIHAACSAVLDGAAFYTASDVPFFATQSGPAFGYSCAISGAIARVTGREPEVTGKPAPRARFRCRPPGRGTRECGGNRRRSPGRDRDGPCWRGAGDRGDHRHHQPRGLEQPDRATRPPIT
jgi:hypothetical protein